MYIRVKVSLFMSSFTDSTNRCKALHVLLNCSDLESIFWGPGTAPWKLEWCWCASGFSNARILHAWTITKRTMVQVIIAVVFCSKLHKPRHIFQILSLVSSLFRLVTYRVMQSVGNSFCGDVVLNSFNETYLDEDSNLDQIYKKKRSLLFCAVLL